MKTTVSKILAAYEIISHAKAAHNSWQIVECAMWMRGISRSFNELAESLKKKYAPENLQELLDAEEELTEEQKNVLAEYYKNTTDALVAEGNKEIEVVVILDDDVVKDFISTNEFTVEQSIDLYEFLKKLGES